MQDDVCWPAVIEEAIRLALETLSPEQTERDLSKLESEQRAARAECERLAIAIEQGGARDCEVYCVGTSGKRARSFGRC